MMQKRTGFKSEGVLLVILLHLASICMVCAMWQVFAGGKW